jgi:integrase
MPRKTALAPVQITPQKILPAIPAPAADDLHWWAEQYFRYEVTTSPSTQKVQRRDLALFISFLEGEEGTHSSRAWSPRLSAAFQKRLAAEFDKEGQRVRSDRTINRIMAHVKTFAAWVHKLHPFPLGNPMAKIKLLPVGIGLEVERALTDAERRKLLNAADLLLRIGGESRDRHRNKKIEGEKPRRKTYRAYRNRAIIYCLIETGMRRAAVTKINLSEVDFKRKRIRTEEKGGHQHYYQISTQGLEAIRDYIANERGQDEEQRDSPALFLAASSIPRGTGRLTPDTVNDIWDEVAELAGVEGKSCHSARHAMGRHIIEKTGNIAAVQRVLGHRNAAYSMQYARITEQEINEALDER